MLTFVGAAIFVYAFIACVAKPVRDLTETSGLQLRGSFTVDPKDSNRWRNERDEIVLIRSLPEVDEARFFAEVKKKSEAFDAYVHPPPDPYFGVHEPGPTCREANLPKRYEQSSSSQKIVMVGLHATERFVFGTCSEKQDVYKSQIVWLYCPKIRTFFELRWFYPRQENWRTEPVAYCL